MIPVSHAVRHEISEENYLHPTVSITPKKKPHQLAPVRLKAPLNPPRGTFLPPGGGGLLTYRIEPRFQ